MTTAPRKQLTVVRSDGKRWKICVTDDQAARLVAIIRNANAGNTLTQDETALLLGYRRTMLQYYEHAVLKKLRGLLTDHFEEEDAADIVAAMFLAGDQAELFDGCED